MDYLVYSLSSLPADATPLHLLPEQELAEASRRGGYYGRIRSLLRQELSRRTHLPPQEITLEYGTYGKPECREQAFNLSHSRDCLCIAFHHNSIGVDVEYMRPRRMETLAARFMCEEQLARFREQGCRQEDFYRCWCTAEALIKHAGDTMWHAQQYPFCIKGGQVRCLFDNAPLVQLFTPLPGYCGAVAYTI